MQGGISNCLVILQYFIWKDLLLDFYRVCTRAETIKIPPILLIFFLLSKISWYCLLIYNAKSIEPLSIGFRLQCQCWLCFLLGNGFYFLLSCNIMYLSDCQSLNHVLTSQVVWSDFGLLSFLIIDSTLFSRILSFCSLRTCPFV